MTAVKKKLTKTAAVLAASLMALRLMGMTLPATAHAEEGTYNIEFKAGAEGAIAGGTSYTQPVTYGGKLDAESVAAMVQPNTGYYFTDWNKAVETTVTGKATYVAQYAKIIEEASYRVRYLDTFGNELATQKVVAASKGGTVVEYARQIDGYIPDAEGKSTTIAAEGTEIDFVYTPADNPAFETRPGVVPVSGQPGDTGTAATLPGGTTAGGGTNTPGDNNPGENIEGGDTPLAQPDEETIDPNETPLANAAKQVGGMANLIMIGVGGVALLAVLITAIIVYRKKKARQ